MSKWTYEPEYWSGLHYSHVIKDATDDTYIGEVDELANARLVAAAPEMLHLLQVASKDGKVDDEWLRAVGGVLLDIREGGRDKCTVTDAPTTKTLETHSNQCKGDNSEKA